MLSVAETEWNGTRIFHD